MTYTEVYVLNANAFSRWALLVVLWIFRTYVILRKSVNCLKHVFFKYMICGNAVEIYQNYVFNYSVHYYLPYLAIKQNWVCTFL